MHTPRTLALALLLVPLFSLSAQSVSTVPVGAVTVTLKGSVNNAPAVSTFTPSLRLSVGESFVGKARGTITSVDSLALHDSTASWEAGVMSVAATPYAVRIRSGAGEGTWWLISSSSANTSSQLTVINNGGKTLVDAGVAVGDEYEIVPVDTLQTFFASVSADIGGANASVADSVRIHDGVAWHSYYYNTGASQWREGTAPFNRNDIIIRPDSAVIYTRKGAGDLSVSMVGSVSDSVESFSIPSVGVAVIGGVFPVERTLGSLGLELAEGFVPNTGNIAAADKLRVFDGIAWHLFHYSQSAGQWRQGTAPFNRNTFVIPAGAALIFERGTGGGQQSGFVSIEPPYTL